MAEPRRHVIGVLGGAKPSPEITRLAEEVGEQIARRGATLICGGLGGVMEACCRGAKRQKGVTIGILPGDDPAQANPYVDIPVATGMGVGRNVIIVRSAQVAIAVDGQFGTLSEIAYCLQLGVPVIGLRTWDIDGVISVSTAEEAVDKALELARNEVSPLPG